jgi:glycosyltransferase involved in cell wall biosynthesis
MNESGLPLVSVIVATRNHARLLAELLDSLTRQTYPSDRFECIIVDNSSEDDTAPMVREFAARSEFTTRYVLGENQGPGLARNKGVELARGTFVAFTDSDCVASPGWLEEGVKAFGSGVGLVQGRTLPRPDQLGRVPPPIKTICIEKEGPIYETCNMFYRRDAFQEAGGFSAEFRGARPWGEDLDLACRVKKLGYKSAFAEQAVVYHYVFPIGFRAWLLEPTGSLRWPYVVRKHPELRQSLFARYFLTRTSALFDLALLGVAFSFFVSAWAVLLTIPFFVERFRDSDHIRLPVRLGRLPFLVLRNGVAFGALALGSIRYRCLLL